MTVAAGVSERSPWGLPRLIMLAMPADPSDLPDLPDLLKIPPVARNPWLRVLLALGGVLCMVLGVVGWLVPVVPGIPFYILGAVLFGMAHPPLGRWINRKERGFSPRVRLMLRPRLRSELKKARQAEGDAETETGRPSSGR